MIPALIAAGAALGSAALSAAANNSEAAKNKEIEEAKLKQEKELNSQERKDKINALGIASQNINSWEAQANNILSQYQAGQKNFSSDGDLEKYQQMKANYNPNDYVYNFGQFDTSKYNVEDYLNPEKDRLLNDVAKASQSTAASTGMGRSSGAATAINQAIADKSESLYKDARDAMNQEKSFDYNAYSNYINQMQNKLNTLQQGTLQQMNQLQGDIQLDQNQTAQNVQNQLSLGNSIAQSRAGLLM